MPLSAPSQDQVMAQLRIIIPALGTIVTAVGVSSVSVNHWQQIALAAIGPISYLVCGIWSLVVNTQTSQIKTVQNIASQASPVSEAAGHALISATIALPQVQAVVTDQKTADAISHPSVVPAQVA